MKKADLYNTKFNPLETNLEIDIFRVDCTNPLCTCPPGKLKCGFTKHQIRDTIVQYYMSRALYIQHLDIDDFMYDYGFYTESED